MLYYYLVIDSLCEGEVVFTQTTQIGSCPVNTTGEYTFREGEDYKESWVITDYQL